MSISQQNPVEESCSCTIPGQEHNSRTGRAFTCDYHAGDSAKLGMEERTLIEVQALRDTPNVTNKGFGHNGTVQVVAVNLVQENSSTPI